MYASLVPTATDLAGLLGYVLGNPFLFISSSTVMTTGLVLGAVAMSVSRPARCPGATDRRAAARDGPRVLRSREHGPRDRDPRALPRRDPRRDRDAIRLGDRAFGRGRGPESGSCSRTFAGAHATRGSSRTRSRSPTGWPR